MHVTLVRWKRVNEYIMAQKNFHTVKLVEQLVLVSYKDQLSNTEIIG